MSTSKPLKMVVIGVGALGRHHARILAGMDGVELVGVADPNAQQAQSIAEQHQTRWVTNYQELLDDCDAASIVVPTFLHHEIATHCLTAGKDILIEKPITADVSQAEVLSELALRHDCILQVGHIERFNPAFEVLCETMNSVPRYIRAERFSPFPFRSLDIGAVHDLMIHDIELVLHLVGSIPTTVEATGVQLMGANEDTVQARLRFPGGCIADISASRIHHEACRRLSLWTSTESISADLQTRQVAVQRPSSELLNGPSMENRMKSGQPVTDLKEKLFNSFLERDVLQASDADALTAELSSFVSCVQNRMQPRVSAETGLLAIQVAEQVLQSWLGTV